jgi:hypothetical protein
MNVREKAMSDLKKTQELSPGDDCEFRFPARKEWRAGMVTKNGGGGFWEVHDTADDKVVTGLYIEHVRAPGTDPWNT